MQAPVLEAWAAWSSMVLASFSAATQFLDTTSLVIGPLTVVRGAAWDGSPELASRSWNNQPRAAATRPG
jgi:hypothetical protein